MLIHDTLSGLKATVTTNCYGYVASAATIIAQAASSGRRNISENSLYLIHRASACAEGNSAELEEAIRMLNKTDELIAGIYANRSGRSAEDFAALMKVGEWLTPEEAKEAGLVDNITKSSGITNLDATSIHNLKLPDIPADKQIKNDNNMKIKLKESWKGILNFFGLEKDAEMEITDAELERINNEMEARDKKIADLTDNAAGKDAEIANLKQSVTDKDTEIAKLKQQVTDKQSEIDKLKAAPTKTKDREDPDPAGESLKGNLSAYENDVKNFK